MEHSFRIKWSPRHNLTLVWNGYQENFTERTLGRIQDFLDPEVLYALPTKLIPRLESTSFSCYLYFDSKNLVAETDSEQVTIMVEPERVVCGKVECTREAACEVNTSLVFRW
jgi:hypothetical protein